ncbi:MAG: hypothetical protein OXN17_08175 [Candidatus Poribacteria bacterium]|nr:hypothetical protein [Candidatus Poribacteria bacterium]MDE0503274.1 hypothetical protein [Candidatus Poribacteria bacterium]
MTTSGLERWFSDLMGEFLLVIIFSVGLPLMYKLANSLKDLKLSVDRLKESLDKTGNNIDKIKSQVDDIEDGILEVESNQKLHDEKTEHGFQRLRDVVVKFRNGNNH